MTQTIERSEAAAQGPATTALATPARPGGPGPERGGFWRRGDGPIQLFPPRPGTWIKVFCIAFGLASVGVWLVLSTGHSAAEEMPTALAAALAAMVALYHAGYFLGPFLVGRGAWMSFLGALTLAPAVHGWLALYGPTLVQPAPASVKAVGVGCLAALVILLVIAVRELVAVIRRPGRRAG